MFLGGCVGRKFKVKNLVPEIVLLVVKSRPQGGRSRRMRRFGVEVDLKLEER